MYVQIMNIAQTSFRISLLIAVKSRLEFDRKYRLNAFKAYSFMYAMGIVFCTMNNVFLYYK